MKQATLVILKNMLEIHEGKRNKLYYDTNHIPTIGIGRNLERGLSDSEIEILFYNDVKECESYLIKKYEWFEDLTDARQAALIDLCFNLGPTSFSKFKKMISAIEENNYIDAAKELLDSKYSSQVGQRAQDLANLLIVGKFKGGISWQV